MLSKHCFYLRGFLKGQRIPSHWCDWSINKLAPYRRSTSTVYLQFLVHAAYANINIIIYDLISTQLYTFAGRVAN